MEMEVGLAPCGVYKEGFSGFWVCSSGKFNQSEPKEACFVHEIPKDFYNFIFYAGRAFL